MKFSIFWTFLLLPFLLFARPSVDQENAILLCENGLEMLDWDLKFIDGANYSVELAACFFGGDVCQKILDHVEARLKVVPKLQVHIIGVPVLMESEDHARIEAMEKAFPGHFHFCYCPDIPMLFPELGTHHGHVKGIMVDERYFSMGGTNFDESMCTDGTYTPVKKKRGGVARNFIQSGTRDQDLVGRGPFALEFRKLFYTLWAMWEHHVVDGYAFDNCPDHFSQTRYFAVPLEGRAFFEELERQKELVVAPPMYMVFSGPMDRPNRISELYAKLIREAKSEIEMANLYFCPADSILQSLQEAVGRGVRTSLITNGIRPTSPPHAPLFVWATRIHYVPLFYGRGFSMGQGSKAASSKVGDVKIYEYLVNDILYHKKVMVVDKHITVIGSYNLGYKSDAADYEIVLVIDSESFAEQQLKILKRDKSLSVEVTAEEARGWYFNIATAYLGAFQKQIQNFI